ncbi:MAG: MBL fold metallo-hydrolase [Clostridia bacterium]|nr:MBL fold metallo-hydrolase [Clostridia bacterium]
MLENIEVLTHSSIKISKNKIIYIDPFNIEKNFNDADIIFITHSHYDHYSEKDIEKVKKENTFFVAPEDVKNELLHKGISNDKIISVKPNQTCEILGIKFETIPAYNVNKKFHPKENNWVGYIIEIDGIRYYIAGDTDINEDNLKVKCNVCFVPVGGTYTMDYKEAAQFVNEIKPKIAVPIHYGSIVGTENDAEQFISLLDKSIEGKVLMK